MQTQCGRPQAAHAVYYSYDHTSPALPYPAVPLVWVAHLVLRGMPILKHCSWISAMQARGLEVVAGGAMSVFIIIKHKCCVIKQ